MFTSNEVLYGQQEPVSAPQVETFSLSADQIGAAQNSVNLFTGDVALPLNLVSMPGRGGINAGVSISYSSNVHNIAETRNEEAPTGILGLGWSMGLEKIVVDHKGTGAEEDDDYYLLAGGASNKLVRTGTDGSARVYEAENYVFWSIKFYPSDERWEIIKENGVTSEFGDDNSGRSTVEYGVKWGNWIGSSADPAGQQQFATAWNLSRIFNMWGDEMLFTYDAVAEAVGYTESTTEITLNESDSDQFENHRSQTLYYVGELNFEGEVMKIGTTPGGSQLTEIQALTDDYSVNGSVTINAGTIYLTTTYLNSANSRSRTADARSRPEAEEITEIDFTYQGQNGSSNTHTKASYLSKVTDVFDRTIHFNYAEKTYQSSGDREYQDPHTELIEPDAYQEKYETRYLDYIEVKNEDADLLSKITFDYNFFQSGDLVKRQLTEIVEENAKGESLPGYLFSYKSSGDNAGALEEITYPQGGEVTYVYDEKTLSRSDRNNSSIAAPSGYSKPRVWHMPDYTIITWRNSSNNLKVFAYTWDGRWIEDEIATLTGITHSDNYQNFEIFPEKDFFALVEKYHEDTSTKTLRLYHRDQTEAGEWHNDNSSFSLGGSGRVSVATGERFAALSSRHDGRISRYVWDGDSWDNSSVSAPGGSFSADFRVGGRGSNFFVASFDQYSGWPLNVSDFYGYIYYLDELGNWNATGPHLSSHDAKFIQAWYPGTSFLVSNSDNDKQRIFNLTESYGMTEEVIQTLDYGAGSYIHLHGSQVSMVYDYVYQTEGRLYRYDGNEWVYKDFSNDNFSKTNSQLSFGYDIAIRKHGAESDTQHEWKRVLFDPNSGSWGSEEDISVSIIAEDNPRPYVGAQYYLFGEKFFHRRHDGTWEGLSTTIPTSPAAYDLSFRHGLSGFTAYERSNGTQTQIFLFQNGDVYSSTSNNTYGFFDRHNSDYQPSELAGASSFLSHNGSDLSTSTALKLYRVIDEARSGDIKDYPVIRVEVDDKIDDSFDVTHTSFDYTTSYATVDASGMVAQYDQVKVVPGSSSPSTTPFGFVRYYFFNGLPDGEGSFSYPSNSTFTNVLNYSAAVKGQLYKSLTYAANGSTLVASTINHWYVSGKTLGSKGKGYYVRLRKMENLVDGVTTVVENSYDGNTGLPTQHKSYVHDVNGNEDTITNDLTYWWEEYDTDRSEHLLSPVIQSKSKTNGTVTAISATTWKEWETGKWGPHKTYVKESSSNNDFDFDNWSGSGEPSSDWLRTSIITDVESESRIVEEKNVSNIYASRKYLGRFQVASFQNAKESEVTYTGFESSAAEDGWNLYNGSVSNLGHTGDYSWQIPGHAEDYSFWRNFYPADLDDLSGTYLFMAWVKSTSSSTNIDLKYVYNGGSSQHSHNTYHSGSGEWELLTSVCDLSAYSETLTRMDAIVRSQTVGVTAYFDDLMVLPLNATGGAAIYDQKFGTVNATVDHNGRVSRTVYDDLRQQIAAIGANEQPTGASMSYFSRSGNGDIFSSSDPNAIYSVSAREGGSYDDFNDGLTDGWSFGDGNWVINGDGQLQNTGVGQNDLATLSGSPTTDYAVRLKVDHISGSADYGVKFGSIRIRRKNATTWELSGGGISTQSASGASDASNWLVMIYDNSLIFLADGEQIFSYRHGSNLSGGFQLYTGQPSTRVGFDDIVVMKEPLITLTYQDGTGKNVQSQVLDSDDILVTEILYDELNRAAVSTKAGRYTNTLFGYKSNFVSSFNWTSGVMGGDVDTKNAADGDYPYTRTLFDDSPLSSAIETGLPGTDFAIDLNDAWANRHTSRITNSNSSTLPNGSSSGGTQYFKQTITDPNGKVAVRYTDKAGRLLAATAPQITGPGVAATQMNLSYPATPTGQFTSPTDQTVDVGWGIIFKGGGGTYRLKVGTTSGGNDIFDETTSEYETDTFAATAGQTYYLTLSGGNGATADIDYDDWGSTAAIEPTTVYEYNDDGYLKKIYPPNYFDPPNSNADPDDYISEMTYDFFGRVITRVDPDAGTTQFVYDDAGRLRFSLPPQEIPSKTSGTGKGLVIDQINYWKYDEQGRVIESGYITGQFSRSTFETHANNATYPSTPNTWRRKYSYDGDGSNAYELSRLTRVEANSNGSAAYDIAEILEYNVFGLVTKRHLQVKSFDDDWRITEYSYDEAGNLQQVDYLSETTPTLPQVTYTYDRLGRLEKIGKPGDNDYYATYSYDDQGRLLTERTEVSGTSDSYLRATYSYNSPGWLEEIDADRIDSPPSKATTTVNLWNETLTYTTGGYNNGSYYNGNIASINTDLHWSGSPIDYHMQIEYDALNQIKRVDMQDNDDSLDDYDLGLGTGNEVIYDANGNFISYKLGSAALKQYKYYDNNRVKNTVGTSATDYQYDVRGNVKSSSPKSISNMQYDPFHQMTTDIGLNGSGAGSMDIEYNGASERVLKEFTPSGASTNRTLYVRGSNDYPLYEIRYVESIKPTPYEFTSYIYGLTGLIAFTKDSDDYNVISDHLGSTRVITDDEGDVISSYDYQPFGGIMRSDELTGTNYRYTGQEWDDESELHNYRARLYDDELGRFYGIDPAGQGFSGYGYAGNNPFSNVDPDGQIFIIDDILIGAAIGALITSLTYSATAGGKWTWSGFGNALAVGAIGGGISGGLGAVGTSLGSFGQSLAYNTFSATVGNASTSMILGNGFELSLGSIVGATAGAFLGTQIGSFKGVKGGWLKNAGAELAFGAYKGATTGAVSGAIHAAIEGVNPQDGFLQGAKNGAVNGFAGSTLNILAMGAAIVPENSYGDFGDDGPVYRRGHFLWPKGAGIAIGRNLVVRESDDWDYDNFLYAHETGHYYQQQKLGFAKFYGRTLSEYVKYGFSDTYLNHNSLEFGAQMYAFRQIGYYYSPTRFGPIRIWPDYYRTK